MNIIRGFISGFNIFCMAFTIVLSVIYVVQLLVSYKKIVVDKKKQPTVDYREYLESENLMPISIIIPAYNEQENIVSNIKDLLNIDYPEFEMIVVNDGSKDETHNRIIKEFGLYKIERSFKTSIPTKEIKGIYYNIEYPNLIYVDKENGGKADALNTGINISMYPLFACLDADSRVEKDALLRLSTEFVKDSTTVVAGGIIRIANGSVIEDGEWKKFTMPQSAVEKFQIVEYFRAFLAGRVSYSSSNTLLVVSGAFGVFKKDVAIRCGGYLTDTIGEDMEIVVRIHEKMRQEKKPYSVKFFQDAVCWTQGPMSLKDLRSQRRRWQIGLMHSLWLHKRMTFNPRYGLVGIYSIPYSWLFELLGAPIEVLGYFIIPLSLFMGELSIKYFLLYLALAICLGIIISLGGLMLEQKTEKNVFNTKEVMKLAGYGMLENFGYRQFITLVRVEGMLKYRRLKNTWGKIKRKDMNQQ